MRIEEISVVNHCVARYIERVKGFDFTELKFKFMLEHGLPSINHVNDLKFIAWVNNHIGLEPFRNEIRERIWDSINEDQRKTIINFPKKEVWVKSDNFKYLLKGKTVITVVNDTKLYRPIPYTVDVIEPA